MSSFTAGLSIAGFVSAAGSAHVSKQSRYGWRSLSGAQTALLVEITGASLFVGVGGSAFAADHKSVVAGTVGISASGVSLRFASVKDGFDSFTDLELSVATASLVGIPGIDLFVSDLTLVQSTSTSVASLDFSVLGLVRGAVDGDAHDRADVSFTAGLSIAGFVSAAGSAHVSKQSVTGGGLSGAQTALLVEITGASLFVGVGGIARAPITSRLSPAPSGSAPPASRSASPR